MVAIDMEADPDIPDNLPITPISRPCILYLLPKTGTDPIKAVP